MWHQTGKAHCEKVSALYMQHQVEAKLEAFIENMAAAYAWADLVVCRAGALTVAEVSAAGVAAVFIPFPHAVDNHQYKNGQWLTNQNAAFMVQQHELNVSAMTTLLNNLLQDRERLCEMAKNARALALPKAAEQVADICMEIAHG